MDLKPPHYDDNPQPTHWEVIDFVSNAVLEARGKPDPGDGRGNSEPINELHFVTGLVNLYMGDAKPGGPASTSPVVTHDFMHQKVMEACYIKSVREAEQSR
jgi:hypothetical protein